MFVKYKINNIINLNYYNLINIIYSELDINFINLLI